MQRQNIEGREALPLNPPACAGQSAECDLAQEAEELRYSPQWQTGIARKVLVQYADLQITLRRMKAGSHIPNHHNPGRICVQTILGRIRMHADGRVFDLPKGAVLVLDRAITHDVEALEESAFLLTVAPHEVSAH